MNYKYIMLTALAVLGLSCIKKGPNYQFDDLNLYQDFVSEVSHGIISARGDVRVVFVNPVDSWENGDVLDKNLFFASPHINGKVVVLDNRTLAFVPEEHLSQDTEYAFTLALGKMVKEIPQNLETLIFGVKTLKQQFNVYTNPLQSYAPDKQFIEGQLRSADLLELETAKKLVSAKQNGKTLSLKFDALAQEGTQFQFKIDSIQRLEEDSTLELSWNGSQYAIESVGQNTILIPGKNNFSVLDVTTQSEDSQVLLIGFSDPIKKGQDFKGLVVLQDDDNPRFSVDGNILKVYPSSDVLGTKSIEVFEGIQREDGQRLKSKFEERIAFEEPKPEVRLLSNGTILPSSNNLKINFEAVNLNAVDVSVFKIYSNNILQFLQNNEMGGSYALKSVARPIATKRIALENNLSNTPGKWAAHALDLSKLVPPGTGAIYRIEIGFKPSYSLYKCAAANIGGETESTENFDEGTDTSAWDGAEEYYDDYSYYDYDWNERENPCHTSYYVDKKIGQNVLASDLGATVKKGSDNTYFIAVNDIVSTNPVAGAKITFYNYQQQILGSTTTSADGTTIFDLGSTAYFAIVENNGQKTYLKLNDGNALSVSKFNVSGVELQKGLKGFIFAERSVWRPGDTVFLSFMLNDNANKLPENHPVKLALYDPYGKLAHRETKTNGVNNFFGFTVQTEENALTGNWLAKISVGGASFTKTIKIETIKPNRLKINTVFQDEVLSGAKPITAEMDVKWLHGAIAKNLKADITAKFNPAKTTFKTFPDYVFDDPTRLFSAEEQMVYKGKTNEEGKTSFTINPQLKSKSPGMLNAVFVAKLYENGGDFSTDVFTKPYSPYTTYVGINVPKGDKARGMLLTDEKHLFEVATVNEDGNPKAVKNLKVTIHKVNWRWWWDTSADNLSEYGSSSYREKVYEGTISTNPQGKGSFHFELKYPNWGRYLVSVEDPSGGHTTGKDIYIDWPGWAGMSRKNDPSDATMLVFSTDREIYNVGETATVTFPSSEGGRALVTIENGSRILESVWVESRQGETIFKLPIKENYTPNVYINIALLQPHASTRNDSPVRLYGMVPVSVENPSTKLQPEINMPKVLRPEERIMVKVKEKNGKPMTYNVAIVDEGLLDLTRFKTPNPWGSFYAQEALGVKTWDVYDDVIGAFGGRIDQVFAIGGDGDLAGAKNIKANRFEPMVVVLGPFSLKAGETKSHQVDIPKYVGSVRTMIVAGDAKIGAYGMAENTTPVRKPLMVLASLPRKITPKEKITLPVTVFAMEAKVKNITVKIKKDKAFKIAGALSQNLSFSGPGEKMVYFDLEAANLVGIGKVVVEAVGDGETASFEVPIDVVNPNPVTTDVHDLVLEANETQTLQMETFGISGSNSAEIEFSTLPPMNFNGRMQYLIQFPHGCLEQTTAAAFPQLFIPTIFDIPSQKQKEIQINVGNAIRSLGNQQLPNGGFSYWPGQNQTNDWGTTFAGHFLLEAEKKGYVLPIGFKASWVKYQQNSAKQWRAGNESSDLAQAYRLYTLALSGNTDVASMNRLRETANLSNEGKYRLAATYALIGQEQVAKQLLSSATLNFQASKYDDLSYGSADRNRAMALETFILLKDKAKAQQMAKTIAQQLASESYLSTQTTSYSLLAMAKFAEMVGGKGIAARVTVNGKSESLRTDKTLANMGLAINKGANSIELHNQGDNILYVSLANRGILPVGEEKEIQRNLAAQVIFKGRDGSRMEVSTLTQGTDFVAEVTLTNTTGSDVKNVALQEIFPSGWEIVNTRFTDFGDFALNDADYTDLRDDRANFYFDLKRNESRTLRILLNASYLGSYYLPGIQAEAMYNNDYMVRNKGQWVEVVQ